MSESQSFVSPGAGGKLAILPLIRAVRNEIGYISKSQQNTHFRYNFRGIDDALNVVAPAFSKNGITPVPVFCEYVHDLVNATKKGEPISLTIVRVRLDLYLYADDGSYVMFRTYGEGKDTEGNATIFAESEAFKVAIFHGLMIPCAPDMLPDANSAPPIGETQTGERASSQLRAEDEGKNRSAVFNRVKNMLVEARMKNDSKGLKSLAAKIDPTASFSVEEKNALHGLVSKFLNQIAEAAATGQPQQ